MSGLLLWLAIGLCMFGWGVLTAFAEGMSDAPSKGTPSGVWIGIAGIVVTLVTVICMIRHWLA
jgi:uncharacterized membrane protein